MKISKGIIKNVNKRLLCGALVLTLLTIPLTGCSDISIEDINYTTNAQGEMDFTIDSKTLGYCSFFEVYNKKLDKKYYTIGFIDEYNGSYFIKIYDIFTKEELKISDGTFRSIKRVDHYLQELDMVKDSYTEAELKDLLDEFIQTKEQNKQLIK